MNHGEISGLISDGYAEAAADAADDSLRESLAVREPTDAFGYAALLLISSRVIDDNDWALDIGGMMVDAYGTEIPGAGELLLEISRTQHLQRDYEAATETLSRIIPLLRRAENGAILSQAQRELGVLHRLQGNFADAEEQFCDSIDTSEEIGDDLGAAHSYRELGAIFGQQGCFDEARDEIYSSLWLYDKAGNHIGMARCIRELGVVLRREDDLSGAETYLDNALARFEALDAQPGVAETHAELAVVFLLAGELDAASKHYVHADELYRDLHDQDGPRILHGMWDSAVQELNADV